MTHILSQSAASLVKAGATHKSSLIDGLDPRMRIILACVFGITTVALTALPFLVLAFALALALFALSNMPRKQTFKRMALMDGFILFMLILLPFTTPGTPMFSLWGMTASWQGLWKAIEIALTANAVILALMVLVGTMEPITLGHALHRLRCPENLVHLLMFTIRYIETLRDEYLRLRDAMKLRGFRPGTNWHSYRSYGYLIGMMLVRAIERSERILGAMKCRGFSGQITLLYDFHLKRRDVSFAMIGLIMCAGLLLGDFFWR